MGKSSVTNIRIYVANLGAYNAGHLIGEWIDLPMDADSLQERLVAIVAAVDDDGDVFGEEWAIHDYEAPWSISEYDNVQSVNDLAERFDALDETDGDVIAAVLDNYSDGEEGLAVLESGDYTVYGGCRDMGEVAAEYLEQTGGLDGVPAHLQRYIDYDAYGRDMEIEGTFIPYRGTYTIGKYGSSTYGGGYVEIHN
jgi:antirestriction protein